MQDEGIIRNRAKIEAAVSLGAAPISRCRSATASANIFGTSSTARRSRTSFAAQSKFPPKRRLSRKISKDLKQRGFKFCGPTIVYAFMQAVGMVNDHLVPCWRHEACAALGSRHSKGR